MSAEPVTLTPRTPAEVQARLETNEHLEAMIPDPQQRQDFIAEMVAAADRYWTRERIPPPARAGDPL